MGLRLQLINKKTLAYLNSIGSDLIIDPADRKIVYVLSAGYLLKTDDSGSTWVNLQQNQYVRDLAVVPGNSTILYTSTVDGVFKSMDGDADLHQPGVAWARAPTGLWKTTDGARTWTLIDDSVEHLAVSPIDIRIMVSSEYLRLNKRIDEGHTWQKLPKIFRGIPEVPGDPYASPSYGPYWKDCAADQWLAPLTE